ncbi:carbohydrate kinase family protein [Agrococcus jejuensis]|uniref:carbohydrate kinase family protein n=1 Tax=Agrococcus jejuensis TaxID=399736 RepID=UPI0011A181E4|nr:carbohydrate kinase [Agrococcus jejuensis]
MPAFDACVVGEAIMDVLVDDGVRTERPGGSPANVALGLGRLGRRVALRTQLGPDAHGGAIAAHLAASDVHVLPSSFDADRTSTAIATIGADGSADYAFDVTWTVDRIEAVAATVLHVGSVGAFLAPGGRVVEQAVRTSAARWITLDPNVRPSLLPDRAAASATFARLAATADVVKLSDEDAAWLLPDLDADAVLDAIGAMGPSLVVLTCGADGASLAAGTARARVASATTDAVDTIGAGDTCMAALIDGLLALDRIPDGASELRDLGERAMAAAAITVGRRGADLPWAAELV